MMAAQRWLLGMSKPIDVYAAFSSERYATTRASSVIAKAGATAVVKRPLETVGA